jgi:HEAT repeat protein
MTSFVAGLSLLVALTVADIQRLERFDAASADADAQQLAEQARAHFAGRGAEIADHFLRHTGARPRNDAYFFVLRALGEADAALVLIRGLPNPPAHESGTLDRHFGEIAVAIEAVLAADAPRRDPRIVQALDSAISAARAKPYQSGTHEAVEAIRLLGECRSAEAGDVLQRLATDGDAEIRTAAAGALGRSGAAADALSSSRSSAAQSVLRLLSSDPHPLTRRNAAMSAGFLDAPEIVAGLQSVLRAESDPRVIDAVVQSLRRRGAPVADPLQCRALIGRTWEAGIAQQMLECWNQPPVLPDVLIAAAVEGPPTQRAIVLSELASPRARTRSLVPESAEPISFDPSTTARLLDSAVWVLSQGDQISDSIRATTEQALWELSHKDMRLSLEHADRITPHAARFRASSALARADLIAYNSARRLHQAGIALLLALSIALMMAFGPGMRRPAGFVAASAAGWALWSLQASGVWDLPPPPLQFLTVGAVACLSAGIATGGAALFTRRAASSWQRAAMRVVVTLLAAGFIGGTLVGMTRSARLFPSETGGWELIFDPLAATILSVVVASLLMALELVSRRFAVTRR